MIAIKVAVMLLVLAISHSQNMFTLQLLSTDRGARCLDGSPAGLYYHEGTSPNNRKFIIYMDSGGFCAGMTVEQTLQSCYRRSKSSLGTTVNYPPQKNLDHLGLISSDPKRNPLFYDWNKFFFIYCDGSEYTGNKTDPISYKDAKLYFRGYSNVLEQFKFLSDKFDFYNGDSIILTGVSAGGMGTYFHSNYLYENAKSSKVYAIPDSGLFLVDYFSTLAGASVLQVMAKNLFKLVNEDNIGFPIKQCYDLHKDDILECYTTSNLTQFLKAPMMIVQSPYDSYSIENAVYTNCLTNTKPPYSLAQCNQTVRSVIEDYRQKVILALKQLKGNRRNVGLWAPSCAQHGYTDTDTFTDPIFKVPSGTGPMVFEAIRQFLQDPENAPWYMDEVPWPYNSGCSGLSSKLLRQE